MGTSKAGSSIFGYVFSLCDGEKDTLVPKLMILSHWECRTTNERFVALERRLSVLSYSVQGFDGKHTIFGKVGEGLEIVEKMNQVKSIAPLLIF